MLLRLPINLPSTRSHPTHCTRENRSSSRKWTDGKLWCDKVQRNDNQKGKRGKRKKENNNNDNNGPLNSFLNEWTMNAITTRLKREKTSKKYGGIVVLLCVFYGLKENRETRERERERGKVVGIACVLDGRAIVLRVARWTSRIPPIRFFLTTAVLSTATSKQTSSIPLSRSSMNDAYVLVCPVVYSTNRRNISLKTLNLIWISNAAAERAGCEKGNFRVSSCSNPLVSVRPLVRSERDVTGRMVNVMKRKTRKLESTTPSSSTSAISTQRFSTYQVASSAADRQNTMMSIDKQFAQPVVHCRSGYFSVHRSASRLYWSRHTIRSTQPWRCFLFLFLKSYARQQFN